MNILVKCINSNEDTAFFKLIKSRDNLNPSLDAFIYSCLDEDFKEDDLLVELIYPDHTELYLEYNLDYISR